MGKKKSAEKKRSLMVQILAGSVAVVMVVLVLLEVLIGK